MKLWLDVDDLFFFAQRSGRPTGIQRLSGETYKAFAATCPEKVGFVVHDPRSGGFSVVDWASVAKVYERLTEGTDCLAEKPGNAVAQLTPLDRIRWVLGVYRTPEAPAPAPPLERPIGPSLNAVASPGDVLCSLGAPWHNVDYVPQVAALCGARDMKFAVLIHDLIPLVRPEYFDVGRAPNFEPFVRQALALADTIFTNSRFTARDVLQWAEAQGIRLRSRPLPVPIGTGFSRPAGGTLRPQLRGHQFALYVSTIEVRKNHIQPFRIWARLLRELPAHRVPKLVFAGSMGWMVSDLAKAIESTNSLNGHLVVLNDVDDSELAALYAGCSFTLFSSHYEGWGLPVSDSLAFGRVCVASDKASIPEAGQSLCVHVDPDNTTEAYAAIRELILRPDHLAELERRVASEFRHVPWESTTSAILQAVTPKNATAPTADSSLVPFSD